MGFLLDMEFELAVPVPVPVPVRVNRRSVDSAGTNKGDPSPSPDSKMSFTLLLLLLLLLGGKSESPATESGKRSGVDAAAGPAAGLGNGAKGPLMAGSESPLSNESMRLLLLLSSA